LLSGYEAHGATVRPLLLLSLALVTQAALADSAPAPRAQQTQITLDVYSNDRNVAKIVLPPGAQINVRASQVAPVPGKIDVLHAVGNASVSATLNGVDLGTTYADELLLTKVAVMADTSALKATLNAMRARDQDGRLKLIARSKRDGLPYNAPQYADQRKLQIAIDRRNQGELDGIVRRYGWPGLTLVGVDGADGAFDIVQHADLPYQQKYLPMIREAVAKRQAVAGNLALLEDRVRVREGHMQLYGTQTHNGPHNTLIVDPIEDPQQVDARRAQMGLGTLADYMKSLHDLYGSSVTTSATH
jgi:hypothetical protein